MVGAALLIGCGAAQADVYLYVDADGSSHYSDRAEDARYQLLIHDLPQTLAAPPSAGTGVDPGPAAQTYAREIDRAARASQVEAALIRAVIAVESNYNPRAISPKGARGLMQLMPATARAYGVHDALDAQDNIRAGALHLRALLDRFANNTSLALAAYNAGVGAVVAHGGQIPPYAETQRYVPAVLQRYARWSRDAEADPAQAHGAPGVPSVGAE